jgi:hypothetical protein
MQAGRQAVAGGLAGRGWRAGKDRRVEGQAATAGRHLQRAGRQ